MSSTSSIFQRDIITYLLFRQQDFEAHRQTDVTGKGRRLNGPKNDLRMFSVTQIIVASTVQFRQLDLFWGGLEGVSPRHKPFEWEAKHLQLNQ